MAGVERLLGEAAGEGECLRNRSDGQRALMPQLKAGKRNSSAEVAPAYCKLAKAGAALELLGAIERCGASSARNAFCTNILDLLRRPPDRNKACARGAFTCRPAQRKKIFSRWTAGPFQADGAVRTGLGDGANGRADHTCNASGHCAGPWDTIVLAMALVVLLERHRS